MKNATKTLVLDTHIQPCQPVRNPVARASDGNQAWFVSHVTRSTRETPWAVPMGPRM